jgi:beta-phosphoglucomutase-like phosphatase (HAD superfamily)
VFDVDALVETDRLHIAAWRDVLDDVLRTRDQADAPLQPFDASSDYRAHLRGRARVDGVRSFLESRGFSLPEGQLLDPPSSATVLGVALRKELTLLRHLACDAVPAAPGARRYLELARDAGLTLVVVSPSTHAQTFLERAGLAALVDACVAGPGSAVAPQEWDVIAHVAACELAGDPPERATAFETTATGQRAARAAGFDAVVSIGPPGPASLRTLLDQRLASARRR